MSNQSSNSSTLVAWTSIAILAGGLTVYALSSKKKNMGSSSSKASSCCPPGALPALADTYTPQGQVHALPACETRDSSCELYIAGGKSDDATWKDKPVLVLNCDIFGPKSGMHRKLADEFATRTKGIVVIPDPFEGGGGILPYNEVDTGSEQEGNGKPKQLGFNLLTFKFISKMVFGGAKTFMQKFPWKERLEPMFKDQLIPFLESKGCSKFAMIGFCYGAWVNFKACDSSSDVAKHITCALSFHPSVSGVEKRIFGGDDLALCKMCTTPQLIHATKQEPDAWKPNGDAQMLLEENPNVTDMSFTLAPDTQSHGFMTRADINDPEACKAVEAGVKMACDFLQKHNSK